MDNDKDLLARVVEAIEREDIFRAVVFNDTFSDWKLAGELGEFLVRISPESELMGHALLLRAHRHLGNGAQARHELNECQIRMRERELEPWEKTMFLRLVAEEEQFVISQDMS